MPIAGVHVVETEIQLIMVLLMMIVDLMLSLMMNHIMIIADVHCVMIERQEVEG